ncbi:MAG: Fe-S-containing protein [Candidatus Accumulibacter sp.]|nr:Fe-S-containing protein [Accumulibacter sp.]
MPTALLLAAHWSHRPVFGAWTTVLSGAGALAVGITVGLFFPAGQKAVLAFNLVYAGALLLFAAWQVTRKRELFWQNVLILLAAVTWGRTPVVLSLSSTHVINTALLLNLANVAAALLACALLSWLLCRVLAEMRRSARGLLLAATVLTLLTPLSGNIVLASMRLQILELGKSNLSYAAKTTNLDNFTPYALLAWTGLALLAYFASRLVPRRRHWLAQTDLIARRIAEAAYRRTRVSLLVNLLLALSMLGCKLYWDLVASRPPTLSKATTVQMRADDTIRLPLAPLMNGDLHRFAWVSDDGRLVRFFIINRQEGRVSPAVVFDACLLCGDKGYVQSGDQVICVGCGVYMFKPSIGKPGGCNPVPLENWKVEGEDVVIAKTSLEAGLQLFNTVLTIEVTDPVSGKKLTNTTAAHRYNYATKTYFFVDEASLNAFRDDPEKYIGAARRSPAAPSSAEPKEDGAANPRNAAAPEGEAP